MEEAIIAFLLGNGALAALVGNRITWSTLPQGQTLPAIVLTIANSLPEYSVDLLENKLTASRLQVDAWGLQYEDAKLASRAVFALLSAANVTIANVEFQAIYAESSEDYFEQGMGNRDLWRTRTDYLIWHAAT